MKIVNEYEVSIFDFEAWNGGADTLEDLTDEDCDIIECELEMMYPDGMSETELNDFLRFERDYIAELLGYDDYDELLEDRKED